ncbi:PDR/VanB family oxidoreductase [Pseudomonas sp. Irchel 3E13]|uniref:PDR/VanB family oxidoreductase n=1 Tax=Pseudomonas sp. Irchel 3E13 TaxID=2008975 RepID=UPI000BA3E015|nr:PDR/VanB family oxidoreductase [Pseudomonas sp. Irchel 3E13]
MMDVQIKAMRLVARDILSLELASISGAELPAFDAGAHIDVHLPNGLVRQYSLWNSPHERNRYCIGVLRDPASRGGSSAVHQLLKVGQVITVGEPRNLFPLQPAKRSILFAGGIGITPILAMAQSLARQGGDFVLHYCARSPDSAAFVERLRAMPFAAQVQLHFDDGAAAQRLNLQTVLEAEPGDSQLYVCGPGGFMEHVLSGARAAGWYEARLHREYFGAAPVVKGEDDAFEVRIHSTGQVFAVPADQSITRVLDEAGIIIPVACEQGICGTCLTRVLDGEPDHRDQFLTAEERARNDQFTPCCSRARSGCLVLDL